MGKGYVTEEEMYVERLDRKLVREGRIINIYEDTVKIPNGHIDKYDFIGHKGAAAVVPVTADGKLLMVRQYRNALDRVTLEIPAGGLNSADEPTLDAARRELEQETGYQADNIELLISIYTTVAFCNEKIDIYVATGLHKRQQHLDEDEFITPEEWSVDDLTDLIYSGKMQDSKTIAAILAYKDKFVNK